MKIKMKGKLFLIYVTKAGEICFCELEVFSGKCSGRARFP